MNLADFTGQGIAPGIHYGRDCDLMPVKGWIAQGLIECVNERRPDPLMSIWSLTGKGHVAVTGIDKTRWPYVCGAMARKQGKPRSSCELVGDCERHWLAGWDEGK